MGSLAVLVGITADLKDNPRPSATCALSYARAVAAAGGVPVILPPIPELAERHARLLHAFVFSGGDDPRMEAFGVKTHASAVVVHPERQEYETRLLRLLEEQEQSKPVLGVCLGMQMMSLLAGGELDQHLPESRAGAERHLGNEHEIVPIDGAFARGKVASFHHQGITDAGKLNVLARSEDGVIEAVGDPSRSFYLGVQWHPERTNDEELGLKLFRDLVAAARSL